MTKSEEIIQQRKVASLIKRVKERDSALKSTINTMLKSWQLDINVDDADETLKEILEMSPSVLLDMPIEDLFRYQWILAKFSLFLTVKENVLKVEYAYDLKPMYEGLIKAELIKVKSTGNAEERKAKVFHAHPKLKDLQMMLDISRAYSETLSGISENIVEMKNVINRMIDKKALDYKFNRNRG